jgi:hypothetical protein
MLMQVDALPSHGSIFAIPLPNGRFGAGRLLLDVNRQCIRPALLPPDSPLGFFNGALLVEVYREVADEQRVVGGDVLIPGVFVDPSALRSGEWPVTGYHAVDPTKLEFPESLLPVGAHAQFRRGEIALELRLRPREADAINVRPTAYSARHLLNICLSLLGLEAEVEPEYRGLTLGDSDLRFSPHRAYVYRRLKADVHESYFALALRHGWDPRRLYAPVAEP